MNLRAGGPNPGSYEYLARVKWLPSGELLALLQDRHQQSQDWLRFDPRTGQGQFLLHEQSRIWLNLHDMFHPLSAGYRDAPRRLCLGERGARLPASAPVRRKRQARAKPDRGRLVGRDLGGGRRGARRRLFHRHRGRRDAASPLPGLSAGGKPSRITAEPGVHQVKLDHACRRFVDVVDSLAAAPPRHFALAGRRRRARRDLRDGRSANSRARAEPARN